MAGKQTPEAQSDILSQIISDDEDQLQLGDNNDNDDLELEQDGDHQEGNEDDDATGDVDEDHQDDDQLQGRKEEEEDDFDPKKRYKQDKHGNLVDDNGKVIVKAGKDRGVFEKVKNKLSQREKELGDLSHRLLDITKATRELIGRYKALQEQKTYGAKLGLQETEEREAIELFARFKTDPKAALKVAGATAARALS